MKTPSLLTRKRFIKTFGLSVAHSVVVTNVWRQAVAAVVQPLTSTTGTLRLNLQDFPALQTESGSVRIGINPVNGDQGPNGTFYPVIINRGPNDLLYALSSRCTHQGCIVYALDAGSNQMNCPCHGSVFAIDGKRVSGPAPSALTKYSVDFVGTDVVEVKIPGLAYALTVASVQPTGPGAKRLELTFRSFRNVEYEVQYRKSFDSAPAAVQFSLTATGATDQTVYTATSATTTRLYVESDSPAGFYTVAIRIAEI